MQDANQHTKKPGALESVLSIFDTTLGRKVIMGLTGLGLVGFVIGHLLGNLSLFFGKDAFNAYTHKLESLGPILYAIEFGLLAVFIFHIIFALSVTFQNKAARKSKYRAKGNAGKPSKKSLSSQTMIYTGIVLLVFTVVHVAMFKYGAHYKTTLHGTEVRDLHLLVVQWFKNPWVVAGYCAVTLLLGMHIRHGFWSAFQSLGAYHPRYTPLIYTGGILLAIALALGFFILPIYVFIAVPV